MSQSPPASLVKLREADVVRFCGLQAAARGIELVSRHAVTGTCREVATLRATVEDGAAHQVEAEATDEGSADVRWHCDCAPPTEAPAMIPRFGCAHVAALLTAWIRHPGDFVALTSGSSATQASAPASLSLPAQPPPQVTQPTLLKARAMRQPPRPATLADELTRLPAADVAEIARRVLGSELREHDEHEARRLLVMTLGARAHLVRVLERLDAAARTLLMEIALLGGSLTAADLDGIAARAHRAPAALRSEVAVLERHALLFAAPGAVGAHGVRPPSPMPTEEQHAWRRVAGWRIAPEVRAALPLTLPLAPASLAAGKGLPLLDSADHAEGSTAARATRLLRATPRPLCLALALLARAPRPFNPLAGAAPRDTSDRREPPREGACGPAPFPLVPGDLPTAPLTEFARGADVALGLAQMARRVLLWAREDGASYYSLRDLAGAPPDERPLTLRAAFGLWRAAESPAELADLSQPGSSLRVGFDAAHTELRPAALASEIQAARQFVLRLIATAQPGVWYSIDALLDLIWRIAPLFLRGRQAAYTSPAWWLERAEAGRRSVAPLSRSEAGRPLRPSIAAEWRASEGEYVRALLAGPLHWWGALDLAADAAGQPGAFRVTPFGRFLLDPTDTAALPSGAGDALAGEWGAPLLAMRDGALAAAPLALGAETLDALEMWARPAAVAGGRLIYRLAPDLACAAFDAGVSADAVIARILRAGGERAATAIETGLRAWQEAYGQSHLYAGWLLIEAHDDVALAEALAAVPELAARCQRLAPALALAPPDAAAALEAALARRGYAV
ncbi:MAG: hypothetical protein OJF49_002291 [Ktedonobacterales bacterium]|jgi:hypothetical protein|nr:MAG: hypothetical protein OJF49_002291 [Ktedonobacterales bacterium]